MRYLTTIISFFILLSCTTESKTIEHPKFFPISNVDTTLDYGFFTITVPNTWKQPNDDTLVKMTDATASGRIQIGENEFVWYSDGLSASDWSNYPIVVPTSDRDFYKKTNLDTSYVIFNDNLRLVDTSILHIHKIWFGNISGYKTKIFDPIKTGYGYTGLYMDSVSEIKGVAKLNFSLLANKLDSVTNAALIKAMLTIKYQPSTY